MENQSLKLELFVEDLFFSLRGEKSPISEATWQAWFQSWLKILQPQLPQSKYYEINLRLTDDREIQNLNYQFRHQNQPTDVLAFASLESNLPSPELWDSMALGDIVISVETAQVQAQEQKHPLAIELAWLANHGFLHLLGWDHPNEDSLAQMLTQQESLLKQVGII